MDIDQNSLTAIFIAGATIAFGKAAQWTKGWQAQEQRTAAAPHDAPADLDGDVDELIGDLPETTGEADLAGDDEFAEEIGFEDGLEFDEAPEFAFEMDEDIDDELMALTVGHEE